MSSYLSRAATPRTTPQNRPIPGSDQEPNAGGGYGWRIGSMEQLRRWCVLGSEASTYYIDQPRLTEQNIDGVRKALDAHGTDAVAEIVAISVGGRAPRPDPTIYALAVAAAHKNDEVRRAALDAIPQVCRIGTHLFMFCEFVQTQRGWGRALRRAVGAWYQRDDVQGLAYQLVKYRQRNGWTHRDVLRLTHPKPPTDLHRMLYDWTCGRGGITVGMLPDGHEPILSVYAYEDAQASPDAAGTATRLHAYGRALPREALLPAHLKSPEVWDALLREGMPMTALIRNLANLTRAGVIAPMSEGTVLAATQIADAGRLRAARVHPLGILLALATYRQGHGFLGRGASWEPVGTIVDALDSAFYDAFDNVEATGKRHVLALDVSSSMTQRLSGTFLSAMEGAVAMAMVTDRVEPWTAIMGFDHKFRPLSITSRMRLDGAMAALPRSFGSTNCALPMEWALKRGIETEMFVVITDNETNTGRQHPAQALDRYREATGIDAKLATVAMVSSFHTIARPGDPTMLDFVGWDSTVPTVLREFALGNV